MPDDLITEVQNVCIEDQRPDGTMYRLLTIEHAAAIAARRQIPLAAVESAALQNGITPQRYGRNMATLTLEDQARLLTASVAVIGLGGLGGTVVELLARTGIGRLHLVDGDRFDGSNLNRQILCREEDLGRSKAERAAERVARINPAVQVFCYPCFFRSALEPGLPQGIEVIIDCLDNVPDRFRLESAAEALRIPMVSAAVAGMSGQVTVILPGDRTLARIYGEAYQSPATGVEDTLGTLAPVVGLVSALECTECIKLLVGRPGVLRKRMLLIDLWHNLFDVMDLD
jgi:molybdopterin/thiamine biosynthesis adenylyltransferase